MSEAPQKLQSAQEQTLFEQLFEFSPDAIVVTDSEGRIANVNARVQRAFGYTREELVGKRVEVLVPERFRGGHPNHRQTYNAQPSVRPMGVGLELYGQRIELADLQRINALESTDRQAVSGPHLQQKLGGIDLDGFIGALEAAAQAVFHAPPQPGFRFVLNHTIQPYRR